MLEHPKLAAGVALHSHVVGSQMGSRALGSLLCVALALLLRLGSLERKMVGQQRRTKRKRKTSGRDREKGRRTLPPPMFAVSVD